MADCRQCADFEWCAEHEDCGLFKPKQKQTNYDRIVSKSQEELAEFMARQRYCTINPIADKLGVDMTQMFIKCRDIMLDWLKQEAEE